MTGALDILALMQDVAARVITPRFRSLSSAEIHEKQPGDLVTVADRESEAEITAALRSAYPDALVVGEEATFADPSLLRVLPVAEHAFVVDPVDGTRNFVNGSPDHAVMVGELVRGEGVRGWIWQPEHQRAYVAEQGSGVTCNDERLSALPRSERPVVEASSRGLRGMDPELVGAVGATRFCCGVDYPRLLTGEIDALVYGPRPKPWDHVPGALMVRELGGEARMSDGGHWSPAIGATSEGPTSHTRPRLVVAATRGVYETVVRAAFHG